MRILIDSYKHKGWRKAMIEELKILGIQDIAVLDAMNLVPRHFLLDPVFDHLAYQNRSIPIGQNQTISQPFTVAFQTQLLKVTKYDKILEIGTGSGYQSTILAQLGANVFTIERQKKLYDEFQLNNPFSNQYKRVKYFFGDGFIGLQNFAPFDKIIITCGAPEIPPALLQQLKIGGIMVIPENEGDQQRMKRITKHSLTEIVTEQFGNFQFVPMLQGKQLP
jgi:protein-L-isoaspartate(D-aspartate) O-methyltransferase